MVTSIKTLTCSCRLGGGTYSGFPNHYIRDDNSCYVQFPWNRNDIVDKYDGTFIGANVVSTTKEIRIILEK